MKKINILLLLFISINIALFSSVEIGFKGESNENYTLDSPLIIDENESIIIKVNVNTGMETAGAISIYFSYDTTQLYLNSYTENSGFSGMFDVAATSKPSSMLPYIDNNSGTFYLEYWSSIGQFSSANDTMVTLYFTTKKSGISEIKFLNSKIRGDTDTTGILRTTIIASGGMGSNHIIDKANSAFIRIKSLDLSDTPEIVITSPQVGYTSFANEMSVCGTVLNAYLGDTISVWVNEVFNSEYNVQNMNENWSGTINITATGNVIVKLLDSYGRAVYDTVLINYSAGLDTIAPIDITGLNAIAGNETVALSWNKSFEPDARDYYIYYDTQNIVDINSVQYSESIPVSNGETFIVSNLINGQKYYFAVVCSDKTNNQKNNPLEIAVAVPNSNGTNYNIVSGDAIDTVYADFSNSDFSGCTVAIVDSLSLTVVDKVLTDTFGNYSFSVPDGKYFLAVKRYNSLQNLSNVFNISNGDLIENINVEPLIMGDCNNDNTINGNDFLALNTYYNKPDNIYCDLNNDGTVNGNDFLFLNTNYNKVGSGNLDWTK